MKVTKKEKCIAYFCMTVMIFSMMSTGNVSYGAVVSDLTWKLLPAGWLETANGIEGNGGTLVAEANETGKNFTITTEVTLKGVEKQASQGGIVIRKSGMGYHNSYIIMLHKTASFGHIEVQKFTGSGIGTILASVDKKLQWNQAYQLKVEAIDGNLKVYFDNEETPSINISDTTHSQGGYGLFRAGTKVVFNNIKVTDEPVEPIYHWSFQDTLVDSVNHHVGSLAGTQNYVDKDVIDGTKAFYMDGKDTSITMGDLTVPSQFAISYWVKPSNIHDNWVPIVSKFGTANTNTFWIGQHETDGKIRFGLYFDGKTESVVDTDLGALIDNRWSHIVCTYDGHYQRIYVNGKLAGTSGDLNRTLISKPGTFTIGHKLTQEHHTYHGIIDDVRVYDVSLVEAQAKALYSEVQKDTQDISLLIDQVGFRPADSKFIVMRSAKRTPTWNPENAMFEIIKKDNKQVVKTGNIRYWGEKWASHWWRGDFSDLEATDTYYVKVKIPGQRDLISNDIKIADSLLVSEEIIDAQIKNLKSRIVKFTELPTGTPTKPIETGVQWRRSVGLMNPNTYALNENIHIFRDCGGSNMSELESVTITTNALVDILKYHNDRLTVSQRAEVTNLIELSANYLVDCQQLSADPLKNGRMHHMGMGWSEQEIRTYAWRDMPSAVVALTRAYKAVGVEKTHASAKWLEAAKRTYDCMTHRPYYLLEEVSGPVGFKAPTWGYDKLMHELRVFYDKDKNWVMPRQNEMKDLRTRDIFPAIWACTELYSIENEAKYLDKAEEFSAIVAERQFLDYKNPIEGTYGNFYEFENDTTTFAVEMHQWSGWNMGNYDPLRLRGVMDLLQYRQDSKDSAKWYRLVDVYGENYVLNQKTLTPFGFTPLSMSRERGISFFRSLNHGANSIYGLAAVNHLEIGNFLNEVEYQDTAARNVNYITGMNPGWPNKRNEAATDWGAFSWASGIGEASYGGTVHTPPKGSITNGFTSNTQFSLDSMNIPDSPNGIYNTRGGMYFHEDGVMHSLSFLNGVITLEAKPVVHLKVTDDGQGVVTQVKIIVDGKEATYTTDGNGVISIRDIDSVGKAQIVVMSNDKTMHHTTTFVAGGEKNISLDFANQIALEVQAPSSINKNAADKIVVVATNHGYKEATTAIKISTVGVTADKSSITVTVPAGETVNSDVGLTAGKKVEPYLVYIYETDKKNGTNAVGKGLIK